jgi:hypothetical protein
MGIQNMVHNPEQHAENQSIRRKHNDFHAGWHPTEARSMDEQGRRLGCRGIVGICS